jgi:hypothetical protein
MNEISNIDTLTIVLRCLALAILAIVSQLAFHRKQYKLMIWTLGFWLTIFRLLALRVLRVYAHQDDPSILLFENNLMTGIPSLITDVVLILSSLPLYLWITETYQVWKKEAKK